MSTELQDLSELARGAASTGGAAVVMTGALTAMNMAEDEGARRELLRIYAESVIATASELLNVLKNSEHPQTPSVAPHE